jgi:hypothetical protein
VLTLFGITALTFMMMMYALERRGRRFIFAFGCGCLLSSAYGFLAGSSSPPDGVCGHSAGQRRRCTLTSATSPLFALMRTTASFEKVSSTRPGT